MLRALRGLSFMLIVILMFSAIGFAVAQDATEEPGMEATEDASTTTGTMVTCSSDLIASLYIAERYLGFGQVHDQMMQGGMDTVDVTLIDKGQFAPLFADMGPMLSITSEERDSVSEMMMMDEAAMQDRMMSMMPAGTDTSMMSMLTPATVTGEAAECAALRAELNHFFTVVAFQDLSADTGASTDSSGDKGDDTSTMENANFTTTLSGAAEVPGPGDDDGTGTASITVDFANNQICYNVSVQNLTLPAQAMHIHRGNAGEGGGVVVPFDNAPDESGNATGCVLADAALLSEIAATPASFYVNVHTSDFPDGAVRGQVAG